MKLKFSGRGVLFASLLVAGCDYANVDETGEVTQATAGSGATGTPAVRTSLGDSQIVLRWGGHTVRVKGDTELVLQDLTIQPGGHTGWHTHGGPVLVSLLPNTGSLTLFDADDACGPGETYNAPTAAGNTASAFVDPGGDHVHIARNLGTTTTVVRVTYIVPTNAPFRIDQPEPSVCQISNCPDRGCVPSVPPPLDPT